MMKARLLAAAAALFVGAAALKGQPALTEVRLTPENVHWGYYDSRLKPICACGTRWTHSRRDDGRWRAAAAAAGRRQG